MPLRGLYSRIDRDELLRRTRYRIEEQDTEQQVRPRTCSVDLFSGGLGGQHVMPSLGGLQLEYDASYSRAENRTPDGYEVRFRQQVFTEPVGDPETGESSRGRASSPAATPSTPTPPSTWNRLTRGDRHARPATRPPGHVPADAPQRGDGVSDARPEPAARGDDGAWPRARRVMKRSVCFVNGRDASCPYGIRIFTCSAGTRSSAARAGPTAPSSSASPPSAGPSPASLWPPSSLLDLRRTFSPPRFRVDLSGFGLAWLIVAGYLVLAFGLSTLLGR